MSFENLKIYVYYILKELRSNILGNLGMIAVSLITITLSMMIITSLLLAYFNFKAIESKLMSYVKIHAYLEDNLSRDEVEEIIKEIKSMPNVVDVTFVPKDLVFKRAIKELGIKLRRKLIYNPMPDVLEISLSSPEHVEEVAKQISEIKGIQDLEYWQRYLKSFKKVFVALERGATLLFLLILIASIFIIANTIRLTVLARSREIKIMQMFGAALWYIRAPLILEGVLLTLTATLIAIFLVSLGYLKFYLWFLSTAKLVNIIPPSKLKGLWLLLTLSSVVIGGIGSYVSLESSLKELSSRD